MEKKKPAFFHGENPRKKIEDYRPNLGALPKATILDVIPDNKRRCGPLGTPIACVRESKTVRNGGGELQSPSLLKQLDHEEGPAAKGRIWTKEGASFTSIGLRAVDL